MVSPQSNESYIAKLKLENNHNVAFIFDLFFVTDDNEYSQETGLMCISLIYCLDAAILPIQVFIILICSIFSFQFSSLHLL